MRATVCAAESAFPSDKVLSSPVNLIGSVNPRHYVGIVLPEGPVPTGGSKDDREEDSKLLLYAVKWLTAVQKGI